MSRNGDSCRMRLLSFGYISLQKYEIAAIFVEFSASDLATIMFYVCFANLNRQFLCFTSSATCPKKRFSEIAPMGLNNSPPRTHPKLAVSDRYFRPSARFVQFGSRSRR